ncbi:MAG: hypothetical protein WAQ27_00715 [Candidatus Microsaccharimonas sp.]
MAKTINITHVGVSSIGRLIGTVNLIVGLAIGLLGSIVGIVNYVGYYSNGIIADIFVSIGILLVGIVVYPLFLFGLGWLYGALVAFIFNVVIGVSGGVELTTEDEAPVKK